MLLSKPAVTSSCWSQSMTAAGLLYAAYTSLLRGLTVHEGVRCVRTASLIGCASHSSSAGTPRDHLAGRAGANQTTTFGVLHVNSLTASRRCLAVGNVFMTREMRCHMVRES